MIAMIDHTHSPAFVIVSAADIARRAYEMYVERGRAPGFDRDDWLRAERELKNPASSERVFPRDSRRRWRQRRGADLYAGSLPDRGCAFTLGQPRVGSACGARV